MFPWLTPNATMGGNLSLLSMMGGGLGGAQNQSPHGSPYDPDYWSRVNAARQPGQSNWDTFMRGVLPQSMWPQEWRDGDRSDQNARQPERSHRSR